MAAPVGRPDNAPESATLLLSATDRPISRSTGSSLGWINAIRTAAVTLARLLLLQWAGPEHFLPADVCSIVRGASGAQCSLHRDET